MSDFEVVREYLHDGDGKQYPDGVEAFDRIEAELARLREVEKDHDYWKWAYQSQVAELAGLREALRQIEERLSIEQMDSPPLPLLVLEALEIARNALGETT